MGHADRLHRRSFGLAAGRDGLRSTAGLEMRAMAVEFPVVHGHPNRLPFEGVLTLVDVASDKAPSGARGHRVVLTREAAEGGEEERERVLEPGSLGGAPRWGARGPARSAR